jgi:TRAP-type C4-dicarboxylate transport system permease small subunit
MIARIAWAYERLLWLLMALASVYVGLMMVAIVYFTSFRAFGWSYNPHAFTFIEYGFIYVLMAGGPWLVRTKGHVYIELLTAAVPAGVRNYLSRGVALLCVIICLGLAYFTGLLAITDYTTNEYDQLRAQFDLKRWVVTGAMPIGFGLMGIEFLRYVFGRETLHTGKAGVAGEA